jgi:hypothetical protein
LPRGSRGVVSRWGRVRSAALRITSRESTAIIL